MEEHVSKTQKKREADTLQKVGISLVELSLEKLKLLPLTDPLYQAIVDAKRIKSHGAKRRQAQLIGKLMRAADHEAILEAYQQMLEEESAVTATFHEIELWRDKLINDGKDALTEMMNQYPVDDVQHLRQLIKKAIDDKQQEKNTGAAKALFRQLRNIIK